MLRICVCDDDDKDVNTVKKYLDKYFSDSEEKYSFTYFSDGEDLLNNYCGSYDIIFLDIEMPHINGMQTAKRIRKADEDVIIIFLTRMAKYAVKGYDVNALDFIVKPVDYPSFKVKFRRAVATAKKRQEYKIEIKMDGQFMWLAVSSVYYIEVFKHNLTYHTSIGIFTARGTLNEIETTLSDKGFIMCSRYCLVNLKHIIGFYGSYILVDNDKIEISRRKRKGLLNALMDYHGGNIND